MTNSNSLINESSFANIVDKWLESESKNIPFPVEFDIAWQLAGYSTKGNAKRKLISKNSQLIDNEDYIIRTDNLSYSNSYSEIILMTCDCFKQFCLMAKTEKGRAIRQYFIEAEKKWKLTEKYFPEVTQEIELVKAKTELERLGAKNNESALELLKFRQTITQVCPEVMQKKILGYSVIETIEFVDRCLLNNQFVRDGSTLTKTDLCYRYKFLTKNGKANYAQLNAHLAKIKLPSEAWKLTASILENEEFNREYIEELDKQILSKDRQLWLGE
jgi:phage anti-repressor protein